MDFNELSQNLLKNSESLVKGWFPNGKKQGSEWCVGSLKGESGKSLKINLEKGLWKDFATDEGGNDLISLYAAMNKIKQRETYEELSGC